MRSTPEYLFRPRLGLARGAYVERPLVERGGMDISVSTWVQRARGALWRRSNPQLGKRLEIEAEFFKGREEGWLNAYVETMRGQLARDTSPGTDLMARALALVAEVAERSTERRPSLVDLQAAGAVLGGRIVAHGPDCDRGVCLSLAAAVAALGGVRVHVLSAMEPRAVELAERFEGLFERLGISSGALLQKESLENRRLAWNKDVVFVGVAALMDEFLKDRIAAQAGGGRASRLVTRLTSGAGAVAEMRLRGLQLALLDDASGLLCDFATRPFVVRDQEGLEEEHRARTLACRLATELMEGEDYHLNALEVRAELTPAGEARLDSIQGIVSGPLSRPLSRRRLVEGAIVAERLYTREQHYEVRENRIEFKTEGECIVGTERKPDEALRVLLEVKEEIPPSQRPRAGVHSTLGRVLRRYLALGGATPSADGLVGEICREFELPVVRAGARRAGVTETYQLHVTQEERDTWIREELASLASSGEGAWVLCSTPESTTAIGELGVQAGMEFTEWGQDVADPRNSHILCAQIGQEPPFGSEGTVVGPPTVLIADCLDALHIERQHIDRLQPTHVRHCICLEDDLLGKLLSERVMGGLRWIAARSPRVHARMAKMLAKTVHSHAEAARRKTRRAFVTAEEEEHRQLAFTGPPSA